MNNPKLGVFLTTFNRIDFLEQWSEALESQSIQATQVLILDNSTNELVFNFFKDKTIHYFRVGYNAGPAGAAAIGLKRLADAGCNWIYWGDDDDPPSDPRTFERLLELFSSTPSAGLVGKVGGKFNPLTGRTRVLNNLELAPEVEADYVPGNKHILISSKVVNSGIFPDSKLFFGFEELEYCLRVKDAGFKVIVDGQGIKEARAKAGNFSKNYRWRGRSLGDHTRINRQYYSVRNMLYILWSRGHFFGYLFFMFKNLIKIPVSIRYGAPYFMKFSKLTLVAIYHQWIGRYGQYISTR